MSEKQEDRNPFKGSFGNLENLVDKISDVLRCPVTIEDANHNLLAYSSHDERTDSARIATIIGRKVPERVVNKLWKNGVIPKLAQSEDPIRVSEITEVGLSNRIAISIRAKNEIIGYIWVLEIDKTLSERDFDMLKKAAETAKSQLLQLQVRKVKKEEGHQEFFWQLLTGHLSTQSEVHERFQRLNIKPPTPFYIIVFEFSHEISLTAERHIADLISVSPQLQTPLHVIDENNVIILCSPFSDKYVKFSTSEFINNFIVQIKKRFRNTEVIAGCGKMYSAFEKIEASYQEALTVLRLKNQFSEDLNETYHFDQLGIYRYLELLSEKNLEDKYFNSSLLKLREYDSEHNTHLVETLNVFLQYDSNVNDAAKQLHVHTNTLNYRLKRISEVGDIDLKCPNEKISLFLDMKLEKLQKNIL
ncbi:PucR family transcriptional regulator [Evansella sp. AB-rgal1]|uniref:PucR family transcriptional regulator n=1 Tax=Evansella sp. AB-rgal1 TaxID=3242696 RepID=UPI00359DF7EF